MKESIPRHAREVTDNLIKSEEKSIQSIQAKLAETTQDISKMEKTIKALESKKSTMAVGLKFGESFTAQYRCQNLIEIEVKTDKGAGLLTLTDNRANMDNHNPTSKEKERAKILAEELKILQGVINRMAQNSLECKKWTLALAVRVLSLKIETISHLYGLCVLGVLLACFYLLDAYYLMRERLFREQ